ncbi:pyridoxamine 5'-phosphate oxidase family protein [Pseudoroseicyclus sp. CXY001]|uniref:pyridoxamine 5'-phosphate oxidase family protein n=1 Tax=Pseudoroseicyclus sp. CXY001 TaxID=3242492 RepID=UPI0035709994
MKFIETREELRAGYGTVGEAASRKVLPGLDAHGRAFLARCPFVAIGSEGQGGRADVTPKGDRPGFIAVLDEKTIAIPDRPGNNRLDTWENVIDNPAIGLLCLIPGMQETLRINGEARLTFDAGLCAELGVDGRPAKAVLVVKIREVFMHCAKAFIRSELWKPESWPDRAEMPTLGQILRDQLALVESADVLDVTLAEAYRKSLW